jgi:hypothetical protein
MEIYNSPVQFITEEVRYVFPPNTVRAKKNKGKPETGGTCSSHDRKGDAYEILIERPKGEGLFRKLGVDGKIILKQILKYGVRL